ncbi:pyrophosphatase [Nonomuraea spiralis]|uniref:Pyrophosphatase n=1 Tax=Nonomuraea spiralis TaxID=46182 RepID=A0ABV5IUV7_9ACTN|nr:pyrophosphatase [Nonomuraea spiralis]GGT46962.1 pyrophosphatase [Nonomuraea spiralis]
MDLRRLGHDVQRVSDRYAGRLGIVRDDAWYLLKLQEEVGELTQAYLMRAGQARTRGLTPEEIEAGFRAELADVLCHVLLMARHHGVDLEAEVTRKWLTWLPDEPEAPASGAPGSGIT